MSDFKQPSIDASEDTNNAEFVQLHVAETGCAYKVNSLFDASN